MSKRKKRVLLIVTSHSKLGDTGKPTGLYLPELVDPYKTLTAAGIKVQVASPKGGPAPIDPKSLTSDVEPYAHLTKNTIPLSEVQVDDYDAFIVVGGHGVMFDLPGNPDLQRILAQAYDENKVVGAVCHGPAALVSAKGADGQEFVNGKHITAFSNAEEKEVGVVNAMPFLLETKLQQIGAVVTTAPMWQPNVVVDGKLVTGQNPASAKPLAEAIVKLLNADRQV